jgi:hypothetical protein
MPDKAIIDIITAYFRDTEDTNEAAREKAIK